MRLTYKFPVCGWNLCHCTSQEKTSKQTESDIYSQWVSEFLLCIAFFYCACHAYNVKYVIKISNDKWNITYIAVQKVEPAYFFFFFVEETKYFIEFMSTNHCNGLNITLRTPPFFSAIFFILFDRIPATYSKVAMCTAPHNVAMRDDWLMCECAVNIKFSIAWAIYMEFCGTHTI